ncbi:phosphoribosyltransferase [Candidatus Caldarchaeum subterraneum]|uniref:Phosphoribosyltransferase n=1 Tax=Caldiarchaeum subterraneum TaxID=311458 RepID=E6N656_CALS0|nr:phosphoribosyltransferase [Candidatus Caldarchaeum subterraneum]BAJ50644.1 phosphoribosyltransferase [Candidatus Caldarchaeum subterraneum]
MLFVDRVDAGQKLGKYLKRLYQGTCVVLGIPRGGVVIGYEVAKELKCPLDVVVTRKIGAPGQPELAVGAVAEDGTVFVDEEIAAIVGVSREYVEKKAEEEMREVRRRAILYRGGKPMQPLIDMRVVIVDDGLATGLTMKAAVHMARNQRAGKVIVAVPVAPSETVEKLKKIADDVVVLETPTNFFAIGQFYERFDQLSDEEVLETLRKASMAVG